MSIIEVNAEELEGALASGARLVDVRETDEYEAGHVVGAVHIALGIVPDRVEAFHGEAVYVICRSGARSMRACELLAEQGVQAINVAGGTIGWLSSGRPVVTGSRPL